MSPMIHIHTAPFKPHIAHLWDFELLCTFEAQLSALADPHGEGQVPIIGDLNFLQYSSTW